MIKPEIRDWLGPETRIGIEPIVAHGGMDAQALRFERYVRHRKLGIDEGIRSDTGRSVGEPFAGA
jgi:hypothetical protein